MGAETTRSHVFDRSPPVGAVTTRSHVFDRSPPVGGGDYTQSCLRLIPAGSPLTRSGAAVGLVEVAV